MNIKPVILITGASSGIGKVTATRLVQAGYTVYGTSRNPDPHSIEDFRMVPLDISDDESVQRCVGSMFSSTMSNQSTIYPP